MDLISKLLLIDNNVQRRAAISHTLAASNIHVEPFESLGELQKSWPQNGTLLVYDTNDTIEHLIEQMAQKGHWLPIIAFHEEPNTQRIVQTILDGAVDYLTWPIAPDTLFEDLNRAITRAGALGNAKLREVMARARIERLTRREKEVLGGVASGLSNRKIGEKLCISPRTVEIHRANMLNKLGAHHTSEAIRIAIEAALVQ